MLPALVTEIVLFVESLSTITPPIVVVVAATRDIVLAALPLQVTPAVPKVKPAPSDNALLTFLASPTTKVDCAAQVGAALPLLSST